jgi:tetratricopeptide (TPR) repeat protein
VTRAPAHDRRTSVEAIAIGVSLFAIYGYGASPTIYVGDSGELVAAVATLGIPHPSGYPLYVLLGKLWTLLVPVGSVAYRMSLFSAATAAIAAAGLYAVARRSLGLERHAALLACGLLAFAPSYWGEANVQRVYALNAVFVVAALAAALVWARSPSLPALSLVAFVCGLGASNHTFMALFAVAFGLFAVARDPALLLRPSRAITSVACGGGAFFLGLLPYVYLPIRSRMEPLLDWGDPETLPAFLDVVLRSGFWERAWIESAADVPVIAADYLLAIAREAAWLGAPLVLLGIVAGWRRGLPVALPLLVMAANLAALTWHGSRSDIFIWHRYYIPSFVMTALLAGVGWQALAARLPGRARAAALALPAFLLAAGWRDFDRSRYRIAEDFAYSVFESLPPGAHLIATDDNVLFVLIYLHLVEGRRPDVDLILQGVGKANLPPLRFDPAEEPVYFTHHPNWNVPQFEIVPMGVVYRTWPRNAPLPDVVVPRAELDGETDPRVPKDYLTQNLIGHFRYTLGFTFENRDWRRARYEFARAASASPNNDVLFYNLGLVYARNGLLPEAEAAFARSHEINPRHIASTSKAHAAAKLAELRAEAARVAEVEDKLYATRPDLPSRQSVAYHVLMADLLDAAGEALAARGHRLRALEGPQP